MSVLILAATLFMLGTSAAIFAGRLEARPLPGLVLTAYLLALAEIVTLALTLSALHTLERWSVVLGITVLFGAALLVRRSRPRPSRGSIRAVLVQLRALLGDPVLAVLGAFVGAGLVYSAALGISTPPNDWDAMTYHLARAAFWIQAHGVGYVPESDVIRINANPPNAEIACLFTMLLSGGDRFVWLVEYTALLALAVGVFGVARRIGLDRQSALLGSLLFVTLPPVLLQSSSALNDLVVASFLLSAVYFFLGSTRNELGLGGLAVALAIGTKFTALIALPLLVLVSIAGTSRRRWPGVALATFAGGAVGSYWLVVNLVERGSIDGGAGEELDQHPDRRPEAVLARTTRLLVNFADDLNLGSDLMVYALAAVVFAVTAVLLDRHGPRRWIVAAGAVAVGCLPLAMPWIRDTLVRIHEKLWLVLGERELAFLDPDREAWSPSTVASYYGPGGLMALVAGGAFVAYAVRRGHVRPLSLLLAAAPLLSGLALALTLVYDPWRGRFFLFALALSAATWGIVLHRRAVAWGLASVASATVVLVFVHSLEKPAGVRVFENTAAEGVWGRSREAVQTTLRPDGSAEVIRFFVRRPPTGRVALRIGEDDWVYPYFGRSLGREVHFVNAKSELDDFDWLVTRSHREAPDDAGWVLALETSDGLFVYERASASS